MRRILATLLVASIGIVCAGCTSDGGAGPYASNFADALAHTDSAYVRAILEDGRVSVAEMHDAQQQNLACLERAGISASYRDNGAGYSTLVTSGDPSTSRTQAQVACHGEWIGEIETLYISGVVNPNNEDMDGLIASCLVRKGVAPTGFTGQELRSLLDQTSRRITDSGESDPAGSGMVSLAPTGEIVLPGGGSMSDPLAIMCRLNPSK